ncbi:MAG: cytochrome C, partial [Pseudomonadota bacterium]
MKRLLLPAFIALFFSAFAALPCAQAVDEENCLFCHKYRGLSFINKEGKFRLLYITEDLYMNSPHGNLKCKNCHIDIDKIPHGDVKKVDCLIACHMNDPSSRLPFSHKNVGKYLADSVHGKLDKDGKPKPYPEDYPDCLTCHQDPLYRPLAFLNVEKPGLEKKTIERCSICHQEKTFMNKFFSHFTSRMQKLRKPLEVIELCGSCHGNTEMMKRHNLPNLIKSYMETYHGKALVFGDEKAAECTD